MKLSIVICTWNRSSLLAQTLEQFTRLRVPEHSTWEVLIVNNACTDDTDAVIKRFDGSLPIRRLFEAVAGHTHARNCAIRHATGDLLIWTDDDVLVSEDWLTRYEEAYARYP